MAHRHVVVVGLMATGKSTVGRALAEHLGVAFLDNDEMLRARCGRTAAEVQAAAGRAELHRLEAEVLLDALEREERAVINAAASVVEDARVRRALQPEVVVWLHAEPEVLSRRVWAGAAAGDDHRPDQGADMLAVLQDQAARRGPHFAAVADHSIDTTAASPLDVVTAALAALGER